MPCPIRLTTAFLGGCLLVEAPVPENSPVVEPTLEIEQLIEAQPLPDAIVDRVKTHLSNHLDIPTDQISTARYSRETWFDGCLGLGGPAELCLAALTEGWQVEVIAPTGESHFYRTDMTGDQIRRSTLDNNLPPSLETQILQTVYTDIVQTENSETALSITQARPTLWNGCYGLPPSEGDACPDIGIFGWRAIVTDGDYHWIYHTDNLGNTILLNAAASTNTVVPNLVSRPTPEMLGPEVLFQSITTGGIEKPREVAILDRNGQLSFSRYQLEQPEETETSNLSQQQIEAFFNLLDENNFQSFTGIYYSPTAAETAYESVALINPIGMVAYAEASLEDLPSQLQTILRSWEGLR